MTLSLGKLDIRSPFLSHKAEGKDMQVFEQEARKTVGEKIKGLFAVICAQTKTMMPGEDNKQDLGGLWMQAASVISQMMNTDHVERNTEIQKASYHLGLAGLVGHTHESQSNLVHFDGDHAVSVRTNLAPVGSQGRMFQVLSADDQSVLLESAMDPNQTEVIWDGQDNQGQQVKPGTYYIRIINLDEDFKEGLQPTMIDHEIDAVGYDDKGFPYFIEGGERVYEISKWTKPRSTILKNL